MSDKNLHRLENTYTDYLIHYEYHVKSVYGL